VVIRREGYMIPKEQVSFVKACQLFFSEGEYGKKIEITELKALTRADREELRELLIGEGYDVAELLAPAS
jgi:hypothetical protein